MVASSYPVFAETQLWRRQGAGPLGAVFVGVGRGDLQRPPRPAVALRPDPGEGAVREAARLSLAVLRGRGGRTVGVGQRIDHRTALAAGRVRPVAGREPDRAACVGATTDPYLFVPPAVAGPEPPPLPVHASFLTLVGAVAVLVLIAGNLLGLLPLAPRAGWRAVLVSHDVADGLRSPLAADGPRHAVAMLGLWSLALAGLVMGKVLDLPMALPATADVDAGLHRLALTLCWGSFVLVATACLLSIGNASATNPRTMEVGRVGRGPDLDVHRDAGRDRLPPLRPERPAPGWPRLLLLRARDRPRRRADPQASRLHGGDGDYRGVSCA